MTRSRMTRIIPRFRGGGRFQSSAASSSSTTVNVYLNWNATPSFPRRHCKTYFRWNTCWIYNLKIPVQPIKCRTWTFRRFKKWQEKARIVSASFLGLPLLWRNHKKMHFIQSDLSEVLQEPCRFGGKERQFYSFVCVIAARYSIVIDTSST